MNNKPDNPDVFPAFTGYNKGITLRDYVAIKSMPAIIQLKYPGKQTGKIAYQKTETILKVREKE